MWHKGVVTHRLSPIPIASVATMTFSLDLLNSSACWFLVAMRERERERERESESERESEREDSNYKEQ